MQDVEVIEDAAAAAVALDPMRARLLAELARPSSAGALATRVGIPRQKLNYHLRALEAHGLVELAEERKRGGITERVMRSIAASYIVSPAAVSEAAADPGEVPDRMSARYLIALAGRLVREVAALSRRAGPEGRVATLAIDAGVSFRSADDRAAFADELAASVVALVQRYHHDDGVPHRLVVAAHREPGEEAPLREHVPE